MRVALLCHGLPQPDTNGGPIFCWSVMQSLREAGHRVTVVAMIYPGDVDDTPGRRQLIHDQGVDLMTLSADAPARPDWPFGPKSRLHRLVFNEPRRDFATARLAPDMGRILDRLAPEVLFAYHWDTLATIHGTAVPKVAMVSDPWMAPALARLRGRPLAATRACVRAWINMFLDWQIYRRTMVRLLNGCQAAGCTEAREADWLRRSGAGHCRYWPGPVPDACGPDWLRRRSARGEGAKFRILLGPSRLDGTSNSAALIFFSREILPRLDARLGADGYEAHVIGRGELPPAAGVLAAHPAVRLRGRVEDVTAEFLSCDAQLVPTPFVLGARVRIIAGFSHGCAVVATTHEAVNLPEMVNESNCLLAADGAGVALHLRFRDGPRPPRRHALQQP